MRLEGTMGMTGEKRLLGKGKGRPGVAMQLTWTPGKEQGVGKMQPTHQTGHWGQVHGAGGHIPLPTQDLGSCLPREAVGLEAAQA